MTRPTATLEIELAGLMPGAEYDVLEILNSDGTGSTAFLDGLLQVSLLNFMPTLGDMFDILFADELVDEFARFDLPDLTLGLDWEVGYLNNFLGTSDVVRLSVVNAGAQPVPEPSTLAMFIVGLIGLGVAGLRRRGPLSALRAPRCKSAPSQV